MGLMLGAVLTIVIICLIILLMWCLPTVKIPKNFPPGPFGIPTLGHLPFIPLGRLHEYAVSLKDKYGPIVGLWGMGYRWVIISDYALVKEAMSMVEFSGRPELPLASRIPPGIVRADGPQLSEQRKFALKSLGGFSTASDKAIEAVIQSEAAEVIGRLKMRINTSICTRHVFEAATVKMMWKILVGEQLEFDDPKLYSLVEMTTVIRFSWAQQIVAIYLPWLVKLAPIYMRRVLRCKTKRELLSAICPWYGKVASKGQGGMARGGGDERHIPMHKYLLPFVDHHIATHDPDHGPPRDFIDMYVTEMKRTSDPLSSFRMDKLGIFVSTLRDLFGAGVDTVSITLAWIFLYAANYPDVQAKMQDEMDTIVGRTRMPLLLDRPHLPFTDAFIHEVMRKATISPFPFPRRATQDVEFHGYQIPMDTIVCQNTYEIHNNADVWGDPEYFRPERFLSKDGTKFEKRPGFMAFGTGRRRCVGEKLARDQVFLLTSSILQTFEVRPDPTQPTPNFEPVGGGLLYPAPHKLVLNLRT